MRRFFLFLSLCLSAAPCVADWTLVESLTASKGFVYIDLATIRTTGGNVRAWTMWDFVEDQNSRTGAKYRSARYLEEVDCQGDQVRTLALAMNAGPSGSGETVSSDMDISKPSAWSALAPNSIGMNKRNILCKIDSLVRTSAKVWQPMTTLQGTTLSFDRSSVRKVGEVVQAKVLYEYTPPWRQDNEIDAASRVFLIEINCSDQTSRWLSFVAYSGRRAAGRITEISVRNNPDMAAYLPDDLVDRQSKVVCSLR